MITASGNYPRGGTDAAGLAVASLLAIAASIALVALGSHAYESVLGIARPVGPLAAVVAFGFVGWMILSGRSWIPERTDGAVGYRPAALIGLTLPVPVIIVDCLGGFGRGINAPAPDSFLFYPSIAVVAEFVFHIAPLAIAAMLALVIRRAGRVLEIFGLGAAVAIEPILQVAWGHGVSPAWANAYVGVQVLAFNVIGVYLLRRFGILRVLVYRLSYYLVWHVLWGEVRLGLLFAT
jgi:hypothetical protein